MVQQKAGGGPIAVHLPHNEPYLGHPTLLEFDLAIPEAMRRNAQFAQQSFDPALSDLQQIATQLVPQAVSIALSIRELIRQGYLFSAALLLRPLIERVGMMEYLRQHPPAVEAWRGGWPREDQPCLQTLLEIVSQAEADKLEDLRIFKTLLHKLIHPDPAGALWNTMARSDGRLVSSSGKILKDAQFCDFVSVTACRYLQLAMHVAEQIFVPLPGK